MAKVKITGHASGTGILTVTAPNTSTDRTITLPDATGTLLNSDGSAASLTAIPAANLTGTVADARISALTASKLTGALPAISGASLTGITTGKVLQISQGLLGSTTTTTSSSYVATSLYLSITPSATSSKVLVMMSGGMNGYAGGSGGEGNFTLFKDVGGGGYSQIDATTRGLGTLRWSSGDNYAPLSINYLDSPNTTSAVTYKLYMKHNSGDGTLSLNRDSNGITQIQLIEIGA